MDSRLSQADGQLTEDEAVTDAAASQDTDLANTFAISSTTFPMALRRRNSAPAPASARAVPLEIESSGIPTADFSLYLEGHRLMSIQLPDDETDPPVVTTEPVSEPEPVPEPVPEPEPERCTICLEPLCEGKDYSRNGESLKPCPRNCYNPWCVSCIKDVFINACVDATRMPARCCGPIPLYFARPLLTKEEMDKYKAKYEEWMTPNPLYCPVPACSTFIPPRLLPGHTNTGRKRIDSGVGTPISKVLSCTACETDICLDCHQIAHPGNTCTISEFGIDKETAELLKMWGYKQCPKCKQGIKRMYGCKHMECLCGAHFCYFCLGDPNNCTEVCYDEDNDEVESDYGESPDDANTASAPRGEASNTQGEEQNNETHDLRTAPPVRRRNLDAGTRSYWESQNLNFGREPGEMALDRSWDCQHSFQTCRTDFQDTLLQHPSAEPRECETCWREVYPEIRPPRGIPSGKERTIYVKPRDVSSDTVSSPLSQSVPKRAPWLMEGASEQVLGVYHNVIPERVVDIYHNTISETEPKKQRRASMDDIFTLELDGQVEQQAAFVAASSSTVARTRKPEIDFAYECWACSMVFCPSCRDDYLANKAPSEAGEEEEAAEEEAEQGEAEQGEVQGEEGEGEEATREEEEGVDEEKEEDEKGWILMDGAW